VASATDSSHAPDLAAALHRLRSVLARLTAELDLAEIDGVSPPVELLRADVTEALQLLGAAEKAAFAVTSVLVVDDDARLGELTALGLRRLGYEAESSSVMRLPRPGEVVVFDLGIAASLDAGERSALKSSRPIVVTGGADPISRAMAATLDATDFLVKPVDLEDLVAAIVRRLSSPE